MIDERLKRMTDTNGKILYIQKRMTEYHNYTIRDNCTTLMQGIRKKMQCPNLKLAGSRNENGG